MNQRSSDCGIRRPGEGPDLCLVVGTVHKTALAGGEVTLPLWMAVALDADDHPAALGLYRGSPTVGDLMMLLGDGPADADGLGPQWTCRAAAAVIVDHAILWQADAMRGWLAERGTAVYAQSPAGPDRQRVQQSFSAIARSIGAAIKRGAAGRDANGAALVTPEDAVAATREWRAARDAAEAAGPAG
ncbi:hypothetical protein ACLBXO_05615 [Methylobacterium sp. C33D]